jgi:hypothetical protein
MSFAMVRPAPIVARVLRDRGDDLIERNRCRLFRGRATGLVLGREVEDSFLR